ncbi:MAG: hypothetical protein A2X18_12190 [Bacteroidetes bacterium GWF2_40_14]|nr:MAG: hypothetical protein A2X18_12190 [Bacteroidetes bacterium GWF2_40_14]
MKRENYIKIDELLGRFIKESGLENGLQRTKVFNAWDEVVGIKFSRLTTNKFYKDKKLHCSFSSSVARDQIFVRRVQIKDKINAALGGEYVDELIIR